MNLVPTGMSLPPYAFSERCNIRRDTDLIDINAQGVGTVVCMSPIWTKKEADQIVRIVDSIPLIQIIDPGRKSLLVLLATTSHARL